MNYARAERVSAPTESVHGFYNHRKTDWIFQLRATQKTYFSWVNLKNAHTIHFCVDK